MAEEARQLSVKDLEWIQNNVSWLSYEKTGHPDSFRDNVTLKWLLQCDASVILLAMGNQSGKSDTFAEDWAYRIHNMHPISWKNLKNTDKIRTFRVCAETLPTEKGDEEKKNSIYQAIMRRFPRYLLKKDITIRNPVQTWRSPIGGPDFFIEYVSYGQTDQRQAGVQRKAIGIDEGAGNEFFVEQSRRITAAEAESGKADIIIMYTPTETESAWMFEDLVDQAKYIYRSQAVRNYIYYHMTGEKLPAYEVTDNDSDVAVMYASLLDNPVVPRAVAIKKIKEMVDPDVQAARGFGLFRQVSGKVYKNFSSLVHVIDMNKYFEHGVIPSGFKFARGIDYHSKNPWAYVQVAISPWDELFVYDEYEAFPERQVTYDIAKVIAIKGGMRHFEVSKIDPLANDKQSNTGLSVIEDLNRYFHEFKKDAICASGYWTPWDTKSTKGLEEMRKRLQNAVVCGKPFNNLQTENGRKVRLPTIWFSNQCPRTIEGMKKWSWQEYKDRDRLLTSDPKGDRITERNQKYSHFPIAVECLLKCHEVVHARFNHEFQRPRHMDQKSYFQARV